MLYSEYLKCAERHLKSCQAVLDSYKSNAGSDFEVFLDVFYITGYILEGLTIYSVYKLYDWPSNVNIDDTSFDDGDFVKRTNLHFYSERHFKDSEGNPQTVKYPLGGLRVNGHCYQQIAHSLLANQGPFVNDNSTPYYGKGPIDMDVRLLIEKWKPEVRYYHKDHRDVSYLPTLNLDLIKRLVGTCTEIFKQTICLIGL